MLACLIGNTLLTKNPPTNNSKSKRLFKLLHLLKNHSDEKLGIGKEVDSSKGYNKHRNDVLPRGFGGVVLICYY